MPPPPSQLETRVAEHLERLLKSKSTVSPFDVFIALRWLDEAHLKAWQRGLEPTLEPRISSTPAKHREVLHLIRRWATDRGLQPIVAKYLPATRSSDAELQVTASGDATMERLYRAHYARADLGGKRLEAATEKAAEAPELVVYQVRSGGICAVCNTPFRAPAIVLLEDRKPVCLSCGDMDHLVFLGSGNATLTRRAKKASGLSAVVVELALKRGRYERQGLLVEPAALAAAEASLATDAPARELQRLRAAQSRQTGDLQLARDMTARILELFPSCPPETAMLIAQHTSERGSGRVGRSAAGRDLDDEKLRLAVIAHIRHTETPYDRMLMTGMDRQVARSKIADTITGVRRRWEARSAPGG